MQILALGIVKRDVWKIHSKDVNGLVLILVAISSLRMLAKSLNVLLD